MNGVKPTMLDLCVTSVLSTSNNLRIIGSDKERVFEDEATVGDQEVENDAIVYVVYRLGEGETWEIIEVATPGEGEEGKEQHK